MKINQVRSTTSVTWTCDKDIKCPRVKVNLTRESFKKHGDMLVFYIACPDTYLYMHIMKNEMNLCSLNSQGLINWLLIIKLELKVLKYLLKVDT